MRCRVGAVRRGCAAPHPFRGAHGVVEEVRVVVGPAGWGCRFGFAAQRRGFRAFGRPGRVFGGVGGVIVGGAGAIVRGCVPVVRCSGTIPRCGSAFGRTLWTGGVLR